MKKKRRKPEYSKEDNVIYVKRFRHYITGETIVASNYGYEAFRIVIKRKRRL